jgi:hypothetical protein
MTVHACGPEEQAHFDHAEVYRGILQDFKQVGTQVTTETSQEVRDGNRLMQRPVEVPADVKAAHALVMDWLVER